MKRRECLNELMSDVRICALVQIPGRAGRRLSRDFRVCQTRTLHAHLLLFRFFVFHRSLYTIRT